MKSACTPKSTSAIDQGHCNPINPRAKRLLVALLQRPLSREEADRVCHASNSPDIVFRLRAHGISIKTERVPFITADGDPSHYGQYWIDNADKPAIRQLMREVTNGTP